MVFVSWKVTLGTDGTCGVGGGGDGFVGRMDGGEGTTVVSGTLGIALVLKRSVKAGEDTSGLSVVVVGLLLELYTRV